MFSEGYSDTGGNPKNLTRCFHNAEKQINRNAVWKQAIFVKNSVVSPLLGRQVLPLRGRGDDKDSNFKQLLNFRGEDDLEFDKWLKKENQTCTSPEIKNEMLKDNESYYTPWCCAGSY